MQYDVPISVHGKQIGSIVFEVTHTNLDRAEILLAAANKRVHGYKNFVNDGDSTVRHVCTAHVPVLVPLHLIQHTHFCRVFNRLLLIG